MQDGISIIVSSHLSDVSNGTFSQHLKKTVGTAVEVKVYANPGRFSLAEIYNRGLKEARYDTIVFVHNDVRFNRPRWGRRLLSHFEVSDFGILGVAGTTRLEDGCWWADKRYTVGKVGHCDKTSGRRWESLYCNDFKSEIIEVVSLDGVFIAVDRKRIRKEFNTDYPGFHFYDHPFCVDNFMAGVKIGVVFNMDITHESVGHTDTTWEENRRKFVEQYAGYLPLRQPPDLIFDEGQPQKLSKCPKVAVLILSKNANELLKNCLDSFKEYCEYPNYRLVIADTGSEAANYPDDEFLASYRQWGLDVEVVDLGHYHFASNYNEVVKRCTGQEDELLLFCNNDIELVNDALTRCVTTYLHTTNCGTVGARLHYGDHRVQHNGMLMGVTDQRYVVTHLALQSDYQYREGEFKVLGNTAGFMLVGRQLFEEIGGFNEAYLECFEDVEFNVKCLAKGRVNMQNGDAVALHLESCSRKKREGKQDREYGDMVRLTEFLNGEKAFHPYVEIWD